MIRARVAAVCLAIVVVVSSIACEAIAEDWLQFKFDERRSGDASDRSVRTPLGLVGTVALGDAILTAPAIVDGHIYAVDGSGAAYAIDAKTLDITWKFASRGEKANCNNVSSPAVVDGYLHFGTTAGSYYVLDRKTGKPVKEIRCSGPIFCSPVSAGGRVYFATLGARVYAVKPDGEVCWTWDFVKEVMEFTGNRWSGEEWLQFKDGRVTWRDHFCCSRNIGAYDDVVVIPAGGRTVFLGSAPIMSRAWRSEERVLLLHAHVHF